MSLKLVADQLALAYEGFSLGKAKNDNELTQLSIKLVAKALQREEAAVIFSGIQLALAEFTNEEDDGDNKKEIHEAPFGNDPDIDNNDEGIFDAEDNPENNPSASPSYEGLTDDKEHEDEADENKQKPEESASIKIAATNFKALYK
jgi:hypothetical protein